MAYAAWSVVFGEQPSAAKWNILGTNDASFNDGTGIGTGVIGNSQLATGVPVQIVSTSSSAVATGTTTVPKDDTVPQITEGTEFLTLAITPKSATNKLVIRFSSFFSSSNQKAIILALFQDATAGALAATVSENVGANSLVQITLTHTMTAGTTSSTTFRLRAGPDSAATVTLNGQAAASLFGGITKSVMTITEYKA